MSKDIFLGLYQQFRSICLQINISQTHYSVLFWVLNLVNLKRNVFRLLLRGEVGCYYQPGFSGVWGFFFNMQKKTTFKPLIFYQSVIKCKACISLRHLFRPCDSRVPASCAFIGHNNFCVKITLISSDACCLIIIKTQPYNRSFCPSWCRTRTF